MHQQSESESGKVSSKSDNSNMDSSSSNSFDPADYTIPLGTYNGKRSLDKVPSKFRRTLRSILPHFGLYLMLFVYLSIGAVIFHYLEAPNEATVMEKEARDIRQMFDTFYKELTRAANIPKTSRFNSTWQKYTSRLFKFAYKASRSQILDMDALFSGERPDTINWSYGNSFLYATTVVTTLGYGNLLPATMFGRIFFIFYATFGIPFLLVTIADIGKFNALMLSHAYRKCVIAFSSWKRKLRGIFRRRQLAKRRGQTHDSSTNTGEMSDSDTDSSSDYVSLRIPMFIVLFIGAVYVVLGAAIFCTWSAKGTTCSSWLSAIFYAFLVNSKITAIGLTVYASMYNNLYYQTYRQEEHFYFKMHQQSESQSGEVSKFDKPVLFSSYMMASSSSNSFKFRRTLRSFLPHFGLYLMLFAYLSIGAVIFHYLEAPNEATAMEKEARDIRQMIDTFYKELSKAANIPKTSRFNSTWQKYTSRLFKFAYKASRSQILDMDALFSGQTPETINWSYGKSFLYATTVVTTLGYGNLLPATMFGRVFFIFYATFGIPLLFVTISDIGKFYSEMLAYVYSRYRNAFSCWKRKIRGVFRKIQLAKRRGQTHDSSTNPGEMPDSDTDSSSDYVSLRIPMFIVLFIGAVYVLLGVAIFCTWSAKGTTCSSWPSAIFNAFLVNSKITAIGLDGDDRTRATLSTPNVAIFVLYAIIGLSCATMLIDLVGIEYICKIHRIDRNLRYFNSWIGEIFSGRLHKNTKTTQKFSEEIVRLPEAVHSHGSKPISTTILPERIRETDKSRN